MKQISNEELTNIFKEVIDEYSKRIGENVEVDKEMRDVVFDIVIKINNLPKKIWTSIAQIVNYNPEVSFVSPMDQGRVSNFVDRLCKKIGIQLIYDDSFGGLAYMHKFKKR